MMLQEALTQSQQAETARREAETTVRELQTTVQNLQQNLEETRRVRYIHHSYVYVLRPQILQNLCVRV